MSLVPNWKHVAAQRRAHAIAETRRSAHGDASPLDDASRLDTGRYDTGVSLTACSGETQTMSTRGPLTEDG